MMAEHYSVIVVEDKHLKENIKAAIRSKLIELGLMTENKRDSPPNPTVLSFRRRD